MAVMDVVGCELDAMSRDEVESRFVEDEGVVVADEVCRDLRYVDMI